MEYKVLYRKYRPDNFDTVYGQDYTVKILRNSIINDKISHAYLFTGPRGTGKTSTAKIFAKAINCLNPKGGNPCGECDNCKNINENPDIIEIDAASNNGVDEIRELINNVKIAPTYAKYKVYIIDEVHMLTDSAFNALLLTLEEPPSHVVFILATTDVQKVPVTILSRCQRFDFKPIVQSKIEERISEIVEKEKIKISGDAIKEIAYVSNGGMRDALSILDQLSGENGKKIEIEDVYQNFGTISSVKIEELVNYFISGDTEKIVEIIKEFEMNGINYSILVEKLISRLRELAIDIKTKKENRVEFDNIYDLIVDLNKCLNNVNLSINPYAIIELTIVKYMNRKIEIPLYNFDKKIISQEITEEFEATNKVEEEKQKNITREIKKEENTVSEVLLQDEIEETSITNELVKTRVNNAFVDASKEYKKAMENDWKTFMETVKETNKELLSMLIDSEIVLASDSYAVISVDTLSTSKLINTKLQIIENLFDEIIQKKCKFICLSKEEWDREVITFKNNKKNGIIYKYIEEKKQESVKDENDMEKIASDLFGTEVIEYE